MAVFNEDTRVKIPATIQFLRLGYNYQSLRDADIDFNTKIFINRFKPALEKINGREFTYDEIKMILSDINATIKNNDLGKEFYNWLINPLDKVKLIDFNDWDNNDFAVVDELPFSIMEGTEEGSFRPDINILINGMPLGFLEVKKPIIIHSRDAAADTLEILRRYKKTPLTGSMHCYSYSVEVARELVSMGYSLGIGGVVTFNNAKTLVSVVEEVPMENILLETDAPYLAPVPYRGKRNSALNLHYVAQRIASIKGISYDEVLAITNKNAQKMFFGKKK